MGQPWQGQRCPPGIPRAVLQLLARIREHPDVQTYLVAAVHALGQNVPSSAWIEHVDEACAILLCERGVTVSRANLRNLLAQAVWVQVFPGVRFSDIDAPPKIKLWEGMRSVIGIQDKAITAPRIEPEEWPRVKPVVDRMTSELQPRGKPRPKYRWTDTGKFLLDIRAVLVPSMGRKTLANRMGCSEDTLTRTAKRLGVDLDGELGTERETRP